MNSENTKTTEPTPFAVLCDYIEKAEARKKVVDT